MSERDTLHSVVSRSRGVCDWSVGAALLHAGKGHCRVAGSSAAFPGRVPGRMVSLLGGDKVADGRASNSTVEQRPGGYLSTPGKEHRVACTAQTEKRGAGSKSLGA